jgi:hypothetical protein
MRPVFSAFSCDRYGAGVARASRVPFACPIVLQAPVWILSSQFCRVNAQLFFAPPGGCFSSYVASVRLSRLL